MKNFININDFSEKEINQIIDAAIERKNSHSNDSLAKNKVLALIFEKDSNELTETTVDVTTDSIAIVDATDNSSKRETIADLVSAIITVCRYYYDEIK